MGDDCGGLTARITALEKMLDEREDRTKERFSALDKSINAAMQAADRAVTKAENATERRFDGVNEFRQTLADQAATLMPRAEYTVQHGSLSERIEFLKSSLDDRMSTLEKFSANLQGRMWAVSAIWAVVVLATSIGVRYIGH